MRRDGLVAIGALAATLCLAAPAAAAQDLSPRPTAPPPPEASAADPNQVAFSADTLDYDDTGDVVTVTGDVHMNRQGNRLRADKVVWDRKTGKVTAIGNVAVTNPQGDVAYGDRVDLTDTLKDGVVQNVLLVLDRGGRLAANSGTREASGVVTLQHVAYTACSVETSAGCPKQPTWKVTAVSVTYRPDVSRIYYKGAQIHLFGLPGIPLPDLSNPIGGEAQSGVLTPQFHYNHTNGLDVAVPYFFRLAPNRAVTIEPHVFTNVLPMLQANYQALTTRGAFSLTGYATASRRSDDLLTQDPGATEDAFRGYLDGVARFQLDPNWSISGSLRLTTDRTFLRRYDISRDDVLRNTIDVERIDRDSYLSIAGWYVQTLRVGDTQGLQPIALPELDYRRRLNDPWLGGMFTAQVNTLALDRTEGQDTQRAFASLRWDLRTLTGLGQQVTFTAYGRGDIYHTNDTIATDVVAYRGAEGWQGRAIGAVAIDVQWPFIGSLLGGTQRLTPRFQVVASPPIKNLDIPNEDARAVDLEDSNLFALNRFPGYDRFEDSTRFTYGVDWALDLPAFTLEANVGQSYRLNKRPSIFPDGTGLTDRFSDIVGRTEIRYRDFVSITHRYRLDKDNLAIRRNELDATIGSRATYVLLGYLRLNRNIDPTLEDLRDREELRAGGRVAIGRFWSVFGSSVIDLTDRNEDPLSIADGFDPVRHRLGVAYEDDCLKLGLTWLRDYEDTGDARRGNSFLLTLSLKNLGR